MTQLEAHSHRSIALLARRQQAQICAAALEHGIRPDEIVYRSYSRKSYGLVNQIYREANGLPPPQFVSMWNCVEAVADAKLVVILDDMAGSGDSLAKSCARARLDSSKAMWWQLFDKGPLFMAAPLVAASSAVTRFRWKSRFSRQFRFSAAREIPVLGKSAYWRQLPRDQQRILRRALGGTGFHKNGLALLFAHNDPDNDCDLVRHVLAPFLTCKREKLAGPPSHVVEPRAEDLRAAAVIRLRAQAIRTERTLSQPNLDLGEARKSLQLLNQRYLDAKARKAPELDKRRRRLEALAARARERGLDCEFAAGSGFKLLPTKQAWI